MHICLRKLKRFHLLKISAGILVGFFIGVVTMLILIYSFNLPSFNTFRGQTTNEEESLNSTQFFMTNAANNTGLASTFNNFTNSGGTNFKSKCNSFYRLNYYTWLSYHTGPSYHANYIKISLIAIICCCN